VEKPAELA